MSALQIRTSDVRWDIVSLGEVMLRLDPGETRVRCARYFEVWEGGGEYNVARGLRKCFGMRAAAVTALVHNELGYLLESLMLQGGVDLSHCKWVKFDGLGETARIGLNFSERGYGVRGAVGVSDRAHSAASALSPGDVDWQKVFRDEGARWFHTGGIFAALSDSTARLAREAMQAARECGTVVSYDLNYRESLWKSHGGPARAAAVNRELAALVDVLIGNEEDFTKALGFKVRGQAGALGKLDQSAYEAMLKDVQQAYPNCRALAVTLRHAKTATRNDWGALLLADGQFYPAIHRPDLEIMDRVGGGDSFASGLIYGFLAGKGPALAVEYGAAHGALAMTTPGDTSMASLAEVEKLMRNEGARMDR